MIFFKEGGKLIHHLATQIYKETFLIIFFQMGSSLNHPRLTTLGLNVYAIYLVHRRDLQ